MDDDREHFERLVRLHQASVCAVAYATVRDRARSEEIAQDAFLVAWQHRDRVPSVTAGWICGIARNLARNAARRRTEVSMPEEPASASRDARAQLIDRENEAAAIAALARLPEPYREAVVLYYRGDESLAAVATALGVSEATARQRVHRGRTKLRDALAPVIGALRATRPGAAFTATCVAAWLAHGVPADASNGSNAPNGSDATNACDAADALPSPAAAGPLWLGPALAACIASTIAIGLVVIASTSTPTSTSASTSSSTSPPSGTPTPLSTSGRPQLRARFPQTRSPSAAPAGFLPVTAEPGLASSATVDLDFYQAPIHDMLMLLMLEIDTPFVVLPDVEPSRVDIHGHDLLVFDALDDVTRQAGIERTEVAAVRLVTFGGRTDAASLGGDVISLDLHDVPLHGALTMIEQKLHMPIGRLAFPDPPEPAPGVDPDPSPHVTLVVHDVPAGVALEQVLAQTGLGYELTTGFVFSRGH
jgi:RNA polymerase sigma factor (sigma-70 family)